MARGGLYLDNSQNKENNLQIGVSGCFENVMELRPYYKQALQKGGTEKRIHIADSY